MLLNSSGEAQSPTQSRGEDTAYQINEKVIMWKIKYRSNCRNTSIDVKSFGRKLWSGIWTNIKHIAKRRQPNEFCAF